MMKLKELSNLFHEATSSGAKKALDDAGLIRDRLTKSEAYFLYGRTNVERWFLEGLITPISENGKISKKCIDRIKLERLADSSNRITYLPVAER